MLLNKRGKEGGGVVRLPLGPLLGSALQHAQTQAGAPARLMGGTGEAEEKTKRGNLNRQKHTKLGTGARKENLWFQ